MFDAIILGAGPAGLSAALALSRVRRSAVIIAIPGVRRNAVATEMHTYLSRDGSPPAEFLKSAIEEVQGYGSATFIDGKAVAAEKIDGTFAVTLEDGRRFEGRKLLVASGCKDVFPDIEGNPKAAISQLIQAFRSCGAKRSSIAYSVMDMSTKIVPPPQLVRICSPIKVPSALSARHRACVYSRTPIRLALFRRT